MQHRERLDDLPGLTFKLLPVVSQNTSIEAGAKYLSMAIVAKYVARYIRESRIWVIGDKQC